MRIKKLLFIIAVLGVFIAGAVTFYIYQKAFVPNTNFTKKSVTIRIPTNSNFDQVKDLLLPYIKDSSTFIFVATNRKYPQNIKSGAFLLENGMSNITILRALRKNIPVQVTFNNQENLEQLAYRLSEQLEPSKEELLQAFTNPSFLEENEMNSETVLALFIPNTYEFFWNTSAEKVATKMAKEYRRFWTNENVSKALEKNLTPLQVSVLASIVQKETAKTDERPRVAGVYLNRLAQDMPLQADPTIIYAMKHKSGNFDQVIKQVWYADLKIDSPYNTYTNIGLPPAPIAMPDISSIKAVLDAEQHNYIYFCASTTRFGYHDFATNFTQHQINAAKYRNWIATQDIKR